MELLQLKYFCDAARCENFSRTAARFDVPTSNISQTVKRLERELGVKLFVRTSNRITLSEAGRIFYDGVNGALASIDAARERILGDGEDVSGEISLLISTNRRIVTLAVRKFRELYPGVSFVINHAPTRREYSLVISDIPPEGRKYSKTLLLTEPLMLALRRDSELLSSDAPMTERLSSQRFVSMGADSRLYPLVNDFCRSLGFVADIAIQTDDPYYVREYLEMGMGVAIVPGISWRGLLSEDIRLIDIGAPVRNTFAFFESGRGRTRAERLFFDVLVETFKAESEKGISNV